MIRTFFNHMTGANNLPATEGVSSTDDATAVDASTPATPGATDAMGGATISGGLAPTAASAPLGNVIKALAAQEPTAVKTVETLSKPTKLTSVSVSFKTGDSRGRKLNPGEQMLLEIPVQFRGRPIRFAVLKHRQDSSETVSPPADGKWDPKPGVTSLQVHSPAHDANQSWRYWKAPWGSSGSDGGKYAEHRGSGDPEVENMFDWIQHGHAPAGGGHGSSHEPLMADAIKVVSVGEDPVRVHQIDMMFLPEKPTTTEEMIFSPGTVFGDEWTGAGRKYGGGPRLKGTYPEALELGGYGSSGNKGAEKLASKAGWAMNNGQLEIELQPGKTFTGVEIACGDTHPDGKKNKDGHVGTLGWSRLSMGVQRSGSNKVAWFIESQGVPPEGVLFGGPTMENYKPQAGDKLIVKASSDKTYVMGMRLWYND
jgi:hypothetical protein